MDGGNEEQAIQVEVKKQKSARPDLEYKYENRGRRKLLVCQHFVIPPSLNMKYFTALRQYHSFGYKKNLLVETAPLVQLCSGLPQTTPCPVFLSSPRSRLKMRRAFVLSLAICILCTVVTAVERYTDKYDNINLQEILNNERLFKKYLECLLADTDNHCTADGRELRKAIPDALTTECSKCTSKQRSGAATVIKHLRDNRPGDWAKLQAKWDPQGVFISKYADRFPA